MSSSIAAGGALLALACSPAPEGTGSASEASTSEASTSEASTSEASTSEASGQPQTTTGATSVTGDADTSTGESTTGPLEPVLPTPCELALMDGDVWLPHQLTYEHPPSLVTLEQGDPEANTPARVLVVKYESKGTPHGNYKARAVELGSAWPEDVKEVGPPVALTAAGHSLSRAAPLLGPGHRIAYVWTGDPNKYDVYDTFFSVLDADALSITTKVLLQSKTNPSFVDLLSLPSGERLVATYTTESSGKKPDGMSSGLSLAVLDGSGATLAGPTPLTANAPDPGGGMRTFWAGDRVAAAISNNECDEADPLCTPHAIVLAQPTDPDGDGAAVTGFAPTHVIDGLASTGHLSRPQAIAKFGLTWLFWSESEDTSVSAEHRTVRAQVLDASGDPLPWTAEATTKPVSLIADQVMDAWPVTYVTDFGVTTLHRTLLLDPVELVTVYAFEVQHFDFSLQPLGETFYIPLKSQGSYYPALTPLAHPRGLLLAWHEEVGDDPYNPIHELRMMRLDCI